MIMMYEGPHHRVCTFLLLTLLLLDSSIENWAAISDQSENPSIHPSVKKGCHQFCETKQILDSLDQSICKIILFNGGVFRHSGQPENTFLKKKTLCCGTRLVFLFFSFRRLKPLYTLKVETRRSSIGIILENIASGMCCQLVPKREATAILEG